MNRRDLLKALAATAPLVVAGRAYAAPQAAGRLLVVFLRGAYDAANIVVPISSDFYYQARPTLAIPRPNAGDPKAALSLNADWGLHPAPKDSILPLYRKGQLAFVPFCGTDDVSRSHFETQDTIELGQPVGGSRDYGSGFMGRLASQLGGVKPFAFTDQLPLIMRGGPLTPNTGLTIVKKSNLNARQTSLIQSMYQGKGDNAELAPQVAQGFAVRNEVYQKFSVEMTQASRGAASPKGFELSAQRIGELMNGGYNLAFVDVGGWDTHINQGGVEGYLPNLVGQLGRGLAAYAQACGPAWNKTVVVVVSEFGRTFRENGDRGTDHGHGSVYWVLGGGVKGGRLAGDQVKVAQSTLFQDRDYPVLNDYRAVMGGIFDGMYGLGPQRLQTVFPGAKPKSLALV